MRRFLALIPVALSLMADGTAARRVPSRVEGPSQRLTQVSRRNITPATVVAVQAWVTTIRTHAPGKDDNAVAAIHAMSFDARVDLNTGLALFFVVLKGGFRAVSDDAQKRIAEIARAASQNPGM